AYAGDQAIFDSARRAGLSGLAALPEKIGQDGKVAVGISPVSSIPDLTGLINAFLAEMESDGVLADMYQRWVVEGDYAIPEIPEPANPERTVRIGTTGLLEPYTFYQGTGLTGYEIEMMRRFAHWANVRYEIQTYDWGGIIPACASGKVDLIMSNLFDTDERDETILFSDPYIRVTTALIIPDDPAGTKPANLQPDSDTGPATGPALPTLQELNGQRFAVVTGTLLDDYARTYFPQSEIISFNHVTDMVTAVISQKAAACLLDEPVAQLVVQKNPGLAIVEELVLADDYAYAAAKTEFGAQLATQLSDFIAASDANGTLDELKAIWLGRDETAKVLSDWTLLPETNGTIRFVTVAQAEPFSYYRGSEMVGYDLDLLVRFCATYGYGLEITDTAAGTWMAGLASGKYDLAAAAISVTPERSQAVYFSTPNYHGGIVAVVATPAGEQPSGQGQASGQGNRSARFQSLADFSGSVTGTQTGTVFDQILSGHIPGLTFQYFDDISSMVLALQSGRVEAIGLDEPVARLVTAQMADLTIFPQTVETDQYGFALAKGSPLTSQISTLVEEFAADGTLEALKEKWFGADESKKTILVKPAENPVGTLRYAHDSTLAPMAYIGKAGESLGYEVELAALFAQRLDLKLEITQTSFSSLLSMLSSKKPDLVSGAM
ncbi:MAG: transporter substrate-binding domain-containing protein, partial [Clostridia bacterium]|nr:transporter substrate-binding domain-containing protein [Clostridia bacterium]